MSNTNFISRGVQEQHNYAVANTSHVMEILSTYLYSDKIQSIVRELSNNALDAHIVAGNKEVPFDIDLPTQGSPTFRIRDYGTGMSPEQMVNMYRFYGMSDKADNDNTIGYMGVGSKSPFCYTDSFTATTYYDGKMYTYVNAKNNECIPTLNLIYSGDTDQPNGVEVSFAVKADDCESFDIAAKKVFKYFDVVPNGITLDTDYNNKILFENDNWSIAASNSYNNKPLYILLVGHTAYKIDLSQLNGTNSYNDYNGLLSEYINKNCHVCTISCNTKDVTVNASREALRYSAQTINYIISQLEKIKTEVVIKLREVIDKCESYRSACQYVYNNHIPHYATLFYNGRALSHTVMINRDVREYSGYSGKHTYRTRTISCHSILYMNDLPRGGISRIKELTKYNQSSIVIPQEYLDDICKQIGCCKEDVIYTSSLPVSVSKGKTKTQKRVSKCYLYIKRMSYSTAFRDSWHDTTIDVSSTTERSFYVPIYQYGISDNIILSKSPTTIEKMIYFLNKFCNENIISTNVVGVLRRHTRPFKQHDQWYNLTQYFQKSVKDFISKNKDIIAWSAYVDMYINDHGSGPDKLSYFLSNIDTRTVLDPKISNLIKQIKTNTNLYEDDKHLFSIIKASCQSQMHKAQQMLVENNNKILASYPLIDNITDIDDIKSETIDYINALYLYKKGVKIPK